MVKFQMPWTVGQIQITYWVAIKKKKKSIPYFRNKYIIE